MTKRTSLKRKITLGFGCTCTVIFLAFSICSSAAEAKEKNVNSQIKSQVEVTSKRMDPFTVKLSKADVNGDTFYLTKVSKDKGKTWCNLTDLSKEELVEFEKMWLKRFEPKVPTQEQMVQWSNTSIYGLWIDGKHYADNGILSKYKSSDFKRYSLSKLAKNARHGINKGKSYQLELTTEAEYDRSSKIVKERFQKLRDGDKSVVNEFFF